MLAAPLPKKFLKPYLSHTPSSHFYMAKKSSPQPEGLSSLDTFETFYRRLENHHNGLVAKYVSYVGQRNIGDAWLKKYYPEQWRRIHEYQENHPPGRPHQDPPIVRAWMEKYYPDKLRREDRPEE